ncbi:MAG: hypothetical protein PHZ07_01670 [Patescibacteria group bacterium]|nr:hypothetical protein [Patescibacteria group bacterium]MDD4304106.1 hypothetical protein [Patescibacteria group bacterium]MDD4694983.1 hypothetical protein [Patescibacteria group bacterium]
MFQPKSTNNIETNNNADLSMGNKIFVDNNSASNNNTDDGYISSESDINISNNNQSEQSADDSSLELGDENIYYMPDKFLQPAGTTKSGKNWFLIIGIVLIIIVVLAVAVFAFYVLNKNKNNNPDDILDLPQNVDSQNTNQNQTSTTTENKLDTPKLRDQKRIKDITDIISGLSLYYNDNKKYPPVLDRLDQYLKSIPTNPEPGGEPYYYQPQDKSQDYIITFSLESGAELGNLILRENKYKATAKFGIEIYKDTSFDEEDDNTTTTTPIINPPTDQPGLLPIPPKGNDTDGDGLTDIEELMYGTKINIADSDSDNYSDGFEIYSLYDPLNANFRLVDNIELVSFYNNENYGYSVLYPKKWKVDIKNTNSSNVTFSNDSNSDFFQIQVNENPQELTPKNWYLSNPNNTGSSNLKNFGNKNVYGVQTQDNINVYIGNKNKIYVISYIIKNIKSLEYFRTFEMFLQSFKFIDINESVIQNIQPIPKLIPLGGTGDEG